MYLDELRHHADDASLDIEIVESDMRSFCRPNSFDAAINVFTSFGYFEDPEDDRTVLRNLHTSLNPGGRLLMELGHREWIISQFLKRDWLERDGAYLLEERSFIDELSRLHCRWIIIQGADRHELEFNVRLYGASNLGALLRDVGFTRVEAFGSLNGAPCDLKSNRLVILATK